MSYRLAILCLLLAACGGSSVQAGPAYTVAVRVARQFCAVVAALPEPVPATTAGGDAATP